MVTPLFESPAAKDEIGELLSAGFKIVDSREPSREEGPNIRYELLKTGWRQHRLFYGDYAFMGQGNTKVGATRKTISDLIGNIGDTFSKQLDEMLSYYDVCIFFLEGKMEWDATTDKLLEPYSTRYTREGVLNYIHRWLAKGFVLEKSTGWEYTCKRLNELYALHQSISMSAKSKKWTEERNLGFPPTTRGLSSQAVLDDLGSYVNIGAASVERLLEIPGIGPKKAELIHWWWHLDRRTKPNVINNVS